MKFIFQQADLINLAINYGNSDLDIEIKPYDNTPDMVAVMTIPGVFFVLSDRYKGE